MYLFYLFKHAPPCSKPCLNGQDENITLHSWSIPAAVRAGTIIMYCKNASRARTGVQNNSLILFCTCLAFEKGFAIGLPPQDSALAPEKKDI